jgi:L-malate glycosyltransferase
MRIGISCHPSAGGSGILATELGIELARRGHEVHFVAHETPFRLGGNEEGIFSHTFDMAAYPLFRYAPYTLALATRMADVADEYGVSLWHVHYAIPFAACALLAREMLADDRQFPLVTTLHGTDITLVGSDPTYFRVTKFAMERSDAVTAVSDWLNEQTQAIFGLSRPVRTIYNFVNQERFTGSVVERSALAQDDERIVMHLSNFRPVKRVTDVVRAFKKIASGVKARLVMVGDGPERISALGIARQLGIADHVTFLGVYEKIESLLPLADLVFQPSEHESFGLVHLEAMACGVPVLGTASGGVCEVVQNGVTGFLCEVGDTDCMADRAIAILTDRDRARQMGLKGRERAERLFAKDRIVDQYEALYADVLSASAPWRFATKRRF